MKNLIKNARMALLCSTLSILFSNPAIAQIFVCNVMEKFDAFTGEKYTEQELNKWKMSVVLQTKHPAQVSRCSYSTGANAVTCDTYLIDKIEKYFSALTNITKYYYFHGQFDLQIFESQKFLENNGRGSIATGKCTLKID